MKTQALASLLSAELVLSVDDLFLQVLLLLPIKSLIRFKSVCKHWFSLITNPQFCQRHISSTSGTPIGLFLPVHSEIGCLYDYLSFHRPDSRNGLLDIALDPRGISISGSCNGLFVCHSKPKDNRDYYVYNPTTNQFRILPPILGKYPIIHKMDLAFDPVNSPNYKVVCLWEPYLSNYIVEIYDSEIGVWRKCGEYGMTHIHPKGGVFWNGSIHWTCITPEEIWYFNIAHQVFDTMPFPNLQDFAEYEYLIKESGGHFHFIEWDRNLQYFVHELEPDYSGWFVKYRIDLFQLIPFYPMMDYYPPDVYLYRVNVFALVRGKEEEDSFFVLEVPGRIVRYNLVCKTFDDLYEFEVEDNVLLRHEQRAFKSFPYIESLSCV